ncbi:MAG: hypothetical protein ACREN8_09935 [Candidatus Dormibacteraceae bacterium]
MEILEDAEDIRAARVTINDPEPGISLEEMLVKYADDLIAHPDQQ